MQYNEKIPEKIDSYRICRRIGSGGLGTVYEAKEEVSNRSVAIKVFSSELGLMSMAITRLKSEIELLSQLQHPHIVPVYSTGEFGLVPYAVMEYIDGPSLEDVIRGIKFERVGLRNKDVALTNELPGERHLDWVLKLLGAVPSSDGRSSESAAALSEKPYRVDFKKIAAMIASIADALAYAKDKNVIHGDIKPSNLLLSADGRLSIVDFALAAVLEQPGMTLSRELLTSIIYTSPEQIEASGGLRDQRCDIYALGAVLYEWITLKPPFDGKRREQLSAQIMDDAPVTPRKIDRRIPVDLETICLKAMEKDPSARYQTPKRMAEDLRRFVDNRTIVARRASAIGKGTRWVRRHRMKSATVLMSLLLVGVMGNFATQWYFSVGRTLAAQFDQKINDAIVVAFAGDQAETSAAMAEIESEGVEPWVLGMVSGIRRLYTGDPDKAADEFKAALQTKPDSVELKALLARSYFDSGRFDEFSVLSAELDTAVPADMREKLFLGSWKMDLEPHQGAEVIAESYRDCLPELDRLAGLLLARSRWQTMQTSFDVDEVSRATGEANLMCYYFRTNNFVNANAFQSMKVSAEVLRAANQESDAQVLEKEADFKLQAMEEKFPRSYWTALAWDWQAYYANDHQKRLEAFQTAYQKRSEGLQAVPVAWLGAYASELIVAGELQQAEQELEKLHSWAKNNISVQLAVLHAERHAKIDAALEELNRLPAPRNIASGLYQPLGLLVLGKPQEARLLCERLRDTFELPPYRREWFRKLIGYGCKQTTAEELIASMDDPQVSHFNRSEGHLFIGMTLLAEGKRQSAIEHFEQSMKAGIREGTAYTTSRFVLEKLKKDAAWPAWIPASPAESTGRFQVPQPPASELFLTPANSPPKIGLEFTFNLSQSAL